MNTTTDYKICPRCGQPAVLSMSACGRCGRAYNTRFTPTSSGNLWRIVLSFAIFALIAFMVFSRFHRAAAVLPFTNPLVGDWQNVDGGNDFHFRADGSFFSNYGNPTKWHMDGHRVVFDQLIVAGNIPVNQVFDWSVSDDGQRLTLRHEDLYTVFGRLTP